MRKLLVIVFLLIGSLAYSQQAAQLEGTWRNQEGEILKMGWKVWERQTTQGLIKGTWEEVAYDKLLIKRSTGEEYTIQYSLVGTTWAIEQPFTNQCWVWFRVN